MTRAAAGRLAEAAQAYGRVVTLLPDDGAARHEEASVLTAAGRCGEAVVKLEEAFARFPESGVVAHSLARLLAACPDAAARDGQRALELATAVLRGRQTLPHAETVAMALAELGRFAEAERLQGEILALARQQGEPAETLERLEEGRRRYQMEEPFRLAADPG